MAEFELPRGQYFSLSGLVTPGTGGQTRALLLRNRLFAQRAGVAPIILTFDQKPHYPWVRELLRERGELVDPMRLVNIYEHYRDTDIDHRPALGDALPPVHGLDTVDTMHPDGTVYATKWVHPRYGNEAVVDYRRKDGSVYLRIPGDKARPNALATDIILANSHGQPVGRWPGLMGFRQDWIRSLTPPGERAFIISDSRFAINYILPMPGDDVFVLYVMHNTHNDGDWNAPTYKSFTPLLNQLHSIDALVTLTERQGADVAERFGRRSNLFAIGNPVELPEQPADPPARARARFAMICRLEPQKAVDDAIRMFRLVLAQEPEATLEIYGDGNMAGKLHALVDELGLGDSVVLKGHDTSARTALWTATAFVVTSKFEGYPLATLESLAYGCPIVAYDVKYGIREQVSDGVDGFLVDAGDEQTMAERLVAMARDPALVARLSEGAFAKGAQHDYRAFLRDWKQVLEDVVTRKPKRTSIDSVRLTVRALGYEDEPLTPFYVNLERALRRADRLHLPGRLGAAVHRRAVRMNAVRKAAGTVSSPAAFTAAPTLRFAGRLTVSGASREAGLDEAVVTLDAIAHGSTAVVPLDVDVKHKGKDFDLAARIDAAALYDTFGASTRAVRFRLRLVWHNSSWETYLKRPSTAVSNYELAFDQTGTAVLWHGKPVAG